MSITARNEVEDVGNDAAFSSDPTFDPVFDDSKRDEAIDRAYQMHDAGIPQSAVRDA